MTSDGDGSDSAGCPATDAAAPVARTRWSAVVTFGVATLLVTSELSMAAFALPLVAAELGVDPASTTWVVLAYSLPLAALALPAGRWIDQADLRSVFVFSLLVIGGASVAAAAAPVFWTLLAARVVQGAASALYLAAYLPVVTSAVRSDHHGRAISYISTIMMLGSIALAPLGGFVAAAWGWRALFLVKVPLLVAIALAGFRAIPHSGSEGRRALPRPDRSQLTDVVLLGSAITAALLAVEQVEQLDRWAVAGALGVAALALLALWARTSTSRPVLTLVGRLALGLPALALLLTAATVGLPVYSLPFFISEVMGQSPDLLGLAMLFFMGAAALFTPLAGTLADRYGPSPVAISGGIVTALGVLSLLTLTADAGVIDLGWRLGLLGSGIGLFSPPAMTAILHAAPEGQAGAAGGVTNLARTLGTTIGPAIAALAWTIGGGSTPGFNTSVIVLAVCTLLGIVAMTVTWTRAPVRGESAPATG
ncbi:MFS transporter [Haloechinothrix sp. YIM 98757]|uniref:MFS transporter n=1 Tax=Haloechinothrix aidingensis TaxID=2752311 RepID=A0A838AGC6_9PSEU|nr:MFS transporter [Haloechinothrix aidingensis]